MAGALAVATVNYADARIVKYVMFWQSDASGDVNGHAQELGVIKLGYIRQIRFFPSIGAFEPSALYDVALIDAQGIDLMEGVGANLSATVPTILRPTSPIFFDASDFVDLVVTNAGDSKTGAIAIWMGL